MARLADTSAIGRRLVIQGYRNGHGPLEPQKHAIQASCGRYKGAAVIVCSHFAECSIPDAKQQEQYISLHVLILTQSTRVQVKSTALANKVRAYTHQSQVAHNYPSCHSIAFVCATPSSQGKAAYRDSGGCKATGNGRSMLEEVRQNQAGTRA